MTDSHLRAAVESFRFDIGRPSVTFAGRLARENGWSGEYARGAIEEYLRFVYLCAVSAEPLTPSDAVDQVWHLHLTYTRSYWDDLCGRVLGRPLHHGPTRGGASEQSKYAEWYARTLAFYERVYGRRPRRDIWPDVEARFANVGAFRRVNTAAHWVIRKKHVQAAALSAGLCVIGVPAYAQGTGFAAFTVTSIVIGLVLVFYLVSRTARANRRRRHGKKGAAAVGAAGGCGTSSKHSDAGDAGGGNGSGCGGGGCGGGCGGG